jgi:hypothetical protein
MFFVGLQHVLLEVQRLRRVLRGSRAKRCGEVGEVLAMTQNTGALAVILATSPA